MSYLIQKEGNYFSQASKYVDSVRRFIYWEYAQLIAKAAGFENNWGFVISRYKKLESGEMNCPLPFAIMKKNWRRAGFVSIVVPPRI